MWKILDASHSQIAMIAVPILLHTITLLRLHCIPMQQPQLLADFLQRTFPVLLTRI